MSGEPGLGLEVHQNKFLAEGDQAMTAIVRVVSRGGEARAAIEHLAAVGGTSMGTWLAKARDLFEQAPDAVRHAILLTDGRNDSQTRADLMSVLNICEGRFGDGREPGELTEIVKVLPEVRLRIGTMPYSRLRSIKQVHPNEYDLTDRCREAGLRELELSLGSFSGEEIRDYQLIIDLNPDLEPSHGQDRQLAWVDLVPVPGTEVSEEALVIAGRWTHNPVPPTLIHPMILKYTVQADLGEALTAGGEAFAVNDREAAEREWGRAVALATEARNDEILGRLARVVEFVDVEKGIVSLRADVTRSEILQLVISRVSRISPFAPEGEQPAGSAPPVDAPPRTCEICPVFSPSWANFCVGCGRPLAGAAS